MNLFYFLIIFVLTGLSEYLYPIADAAANDQLEKKECVILLHGLKRTSRSMDDMAHALETQGYGVVNVDYPSDKFPIEKLASSVISPAISRCGEWEGAKINVVTHSMGGILLRFFLSGRALSGLNRVVMLSPPNQGSEVVDALRENALFKWYNGPAGLQLGTGPDAIAARLGPVTYPVGIITGNKHSFFDAFFARIIPGEDDGKVGVERAKVDGMADFIVLPYAHSFIMKEKEVIFQTLYFLRHGSFNKNAP